MLRKLAVVGDSLSSGGNILPHDGPRVTTNGHQIALIGAPAFCAACKATGVVAKSGGPYRMSMSGEAALDQDIVICGCPNPPKIVAALGGDMWCDDMVEGHGKVVSSLTAAGGVASVKKGAYDEQVKATEHQAEGLPYYIETADGRVHFGRLDANGTLPRVYTGDDPGAYTVHWGDDAIAKHHGE
ncbi:PAAR domain-containing protein [Burkholderia sp. Bp9126]|nr:PAAR domain-containing protein [Burkholderia sp. Bp9126]